jgi:Putative Zn-dependent protease, contains TPR repeats
MKIVKIVIKNLIVIFLLSFGTQSSAQNGVLNDTYIVEFSLSDERIVIDINGSEMEMKVTEKTKYKKKGGKFKKKNNLNSSAIVEGTNVNIAYKLENSERVVTEIYVLSEVVDMKNHISGKLEYVEGDIAFIDGRKVKLSNGAIITGDKKNACGCKGMLYPSFDDPLLSVGSFIEAKGETDGAGVLQATEATICNNSFTKEEQELSTLVENSYNGNGMKSIGAKGYDFTSKLYNGNIKIGEYNYQLVNDIKVQGYINLVGNRLIPDYIKEVPDSDPGKLNFRFFVINDPMPNAFAFPNGMVFIHTGLLKIIDNEAQLALVLGHEIAHVTYEHGASRYKKSKQINTGTKLLGNLKDRIVRDRWRKGKQTIPDVNIDPKVASMVVNNLQKVRPSVLSNLYQKDKENQADRVGLLYIYQAGYDLREAPKFWDKMKDLAGDETFMGGLAKNAESMFLGDQMSDTGNLFEDIGTTGTSLLVDRVLETVFTSHPKATARYNNINLLITSSYSNEDFDKAQKGAKEYMEYVGMYK